MLSNCFLGGILALPAACAFEYIFETYIVPQSATPAIYHSIEMFFGVGLVEEGCKLAVLMLVAYRKPDFNEPFDGIVYAVAVSLGFAAIENAFYCIGFGIDTAWLRMFTAVPMHAMSAVLLGFYVGRAKFERDPRKAKLLIWAGLAASSLAHGSYNYFLALGNAIYFPLAMFLLFIQILLAHRAMRIYNAQRGMSAGSACMYLPEQDRDLITSPITWAIAALTLLCALGILWSTAALSGLIDPNSLNLNAEELTHTALLGCLASVLSCAAVFSLGKRRNWAWKYALTVFLIALPSPLFVLSVAGFFGLFHPESRRQFSANLK